MTAPVEVPEEIREIVEGLKPPRPTEPIYPTEERRWKRDCSEYDDLLSLIAAALVSAKREAIREAVERLPTFDEDKHGEWTRVRSRQGETPTMVYVTKSSLIGALLPPEAP